MKLNKTEPTELNWTALNWNELSNVKQSQIKEFQNMLKAKSKT